MVHDHVQRQVKIAIVQRPVPSDADLVTTHEGWYCFRVEGIGEKFHIFIEAAFLFKLLPKAAKGHVGDRQEVSEGYSEPALQFPLVGTLQIGLISRQEGSARIVNEVELQVGIDPVPN